MPLADTAVRQAKPKDKDYSLSDTAGQALFVAAKGSKPRISLGTSSETL